MFIYVVVFTYLGSIMHDGAIIIRHSSGVYIVCSVTVKIRESIGLNVTPFDNNIVISVRATLFVEKSCSVSDFMNHCPYLKEENVNYVTQSCSMFDFMDHSPYLKEGKVKNVTKSCSVSDYMNHCPYLN